MVTDGPKYPQVIVELLDQDGNAMAIIARVSIELRRYGISQDEIDKFREEAMSGDYDNVLQTVMRWVEVT